MNYRKKTSAIAGLVLAVSSAFAVLLPDGYTQLEYIASTSGGNQYIDTLLKPTKNFRIVIDFAYNAATGGGGFGYAAGGSAQSFRLYRSVTDGVATYNVNINDAYGTINTFPTTFTNDTGRHVADLSNTAKYLDGVQFGDTSGLTKTLSGTFYLFAQHWGWSPNIGSYGSYKIYSCKLYEGASLLCDFVPCKDANGTGGLYDLVNNKMYYKGGGSAFDLGPEVLDETAVKWTALGGGNYANPASWEGGAVPGAGDMALFQDTSSYTVSFPVGGLDTRASLFLSKSSGTTTFDASGTWWRMPASNDGEGGTTYEPKPIQFRVGTKFPLTLSRAVNGGGVLLLSNGVFSVANGDVFSASFSGGLLNLFDPDASSFATNILTFGNEFPAVATFAGTATRLPKVSLLAAKGHTGDTKLRFTSGTNDVFGVITSKNRMALGNEIALEVTGQGTKVNLLGGYDGYPSGNPSEEGNYKAFHSDAIRVTDGATLSATGTYFRTFAADFKLLVDHATLNIDSDYFMLGSPYSIAGSGHYKGYNTNNVVLSHAALHIGSSVKDNWIGSYDAWGNAKSYTWWCATNTVFDSGRVLQLYEGKYLFKDCVGIFNGGIALKKAGADVLIDGGAFTNNNWSLNSTASLTINGGDHSCTNYMYLCASSGGPTALNIGGGKLTVPREFYFSRVSTGAKTILNLTGGELSTPAPKWAYGGGTLSSTVTMNLLGGVWRVPSIGAGYIRQIYANGGTIQATGASTTFLANNSNASSYLRLGPQGLRIFSDYAVTVAAAFTNAPDAVGLLIKDGSGALTLSGASTHSRTMVTNGVLKFAAAVVSHRGVEVVNGARLDVTGSNGRPILFSLTLGDAASRGELAIDNGVFVTATNFVPAKARIRLTDAYTNGTYPVVAVPGEADAATAAAWATNSDCPTAEGKAYTFSSEYDAENDTTTFFVTTADRAESSGDVVWQGPGTSWAEGTNWEGGAAPTATDTAVFSSESAPASVSVPSGAVAGALTFNAAQSYTLSGASPLALSYAVNGLIDVQRGHHTNAVPLNLGAVLPVTVAENASLAVMSPMTTGGIAKEGKGTLALSGANDLPYGIELRDGTLAVPATQALEGSATTLSGGTLRFTGAAAATPASVTISTGAATKSAVIRADVDTELTRGITVTSGAVIKRGAGTLKIDQPAGRALSVAAESGPGSAFAFEEGGTAPTTGFTSLNVAEGDLRVTTSGSVSLGGNVRVGLNSGDVGDAQPRLVVQSGTISAGSRALQLGSSLTTGSTATNPTFVAVNSSVSLKSLTSGSSSSQVPVFPVIALTNATVSTTLSIGSTLNDFTTIRAVNSTLGGSVESGWNGGLDADLDGSFLRNDKRLFMTGNVYGTIRARNGSTVQIGGWMLYPPKRGMTLSFDASTFKFSGTLLFFHPEQHAVIAEAGGMNLDVPSGVTATFRHPISGPGAVTKIGPGAAFFDLAQGANNWQGYANDQVRTQCVDTVTLAYAGPTTIAEGTVIVTNGAVRENAVFKLREAGTLNLRFCEHHFASVTGEGVVTNGGLVATTVAGTTNGVLKLNALSLDRATFSYPIANGQTNLVPQVAFNGCSYTTGVTVDFGHDRSDPLVAEAEGVIATYTGETPNVASWTLTGLGGHRSIPTIRAADGNIYLKLEKTPAGTMILLK